MKLEDAIITQGWHQGGYRKEETGEVCLFGALYYSVFETWDAWDDDIFDGYPADDELRRRVEAVALCGRRRNISDVTEWNDADERTKDEILGFAREVDETLGLNVH